MGGQSVSGRGKVIPIVEEARGMAEALQQAEFRGLGDTREAARYRVSRKTGVPERYLKRLRYQWREMSDVAGSHYRAIREAYADLCEAIEAKAGQIEAEAASMRQQRNAVDQGAAQTVAREKGTVA